MSRLFTDQQYLDAELFEDGDAEIRGMTRKIVVVRKEHRCDFADVLMKPHQITTGSRVVREHANVDGQWGSSYSCLDCVDEWLDHLKEIGSL